MRHDLEVIYEEDVICPRCAHKFTVKGTVEIDAPPEPDGPDLG